MGKKRIKKKILWERQQGQCLDCGAFHAYRCSMTVDHIVPRSKGGGNEITNLRLVCYKCNQKRGDKPPKWCENPVGSIVSD